MTVVGKKARPKPLVYSFLLLLLGLLCFAVLKSSSYPMGGSVVVTGKGTGIFGYYYITVRQGPTLEGTYSDFRLRCTEEQYRSVKIGETIYCDREQSAITRSGVIRRIYKIASAGPQSGPALAVFAGVALVYSMLMPVKSPRRWTHLRGPAGLGQIQVFNRWYGAFWGPDSPAGRRR